MKDSKHKLVVYRILLLAIFYYGGISKVYASELPQLSSNSIVSLITCSPTSSYEGTFGHAAIRLQDSSLKIDVIFNFGMYDPDQSFFFYKVLLGKLESSLEGEAFYKFVERYRAEGRGIKEYYLDLTLSERQQLWETFNSILFSDRREYKFNMTLSNCTTHARDVLFDKLNLNTSFYKGLLSGNTPREIESQSPIANSWLHLLFNSILGANADEEYSTYDIAFSPDYLVLLMKAVNENERSFIIAEHELFPVDNEKYSPNKVLPILFFSVLLLVSIILGGVQYVRGIRFLVFDRVLFFTSGMMGFFFLSLLLFSEVPVLKVNYNLAWALPTNAILAFMIRKNDVSRWTKLFSFLSFISITYFLLFSFCFQQTIPIEAYLFAVTILVRLYFYTFK